MMFIKIRCCCLSAAVFFIFWVSSASCAIAQNASLKVLVLMSGEASLPWNADIKTGADSVLENLCDIRYVYTGTETDSKNRAAEIYSLYQKFRPDGVIAADDLAQSLFAVPYLKNKVSVPVMFCGVDEEPEKYGYPAANVSGILERAYISESLSYSQQIVPSVRSIGFILKDSPEGRAVAEQIYKESDMYPARLAAVRLPKSFKDALAMTAEIKDRCDALYITGWEGGIPDGKGKIIPENKFIHRLSESFGKPTIGATLHDVRQGLLCSVFHTGQEQGETAAKMLLKAMQGTPVSDLPVTRNRYGKRAINVTVMKSLGIKPLPKALIGAELVKTENQ